MPGIWTNPGSIDWTERLERSQVRLQTLLNFETALLDRLCDPELPRENLDRIVGVDDDAIDGGRLDDCQREIRSLLRDLPILTRLAALQKEIVKTNIERRRAIEAQIIHRLIVPLEVERWVRDSSSLADEEERAY
jgi:hypothetical protein